MKKSLTPQQHLALMSTSIISMTVFAGFLWSNINHFFEAEPQSWKWYATLISGTLCIFLLNAGFAGTVLNLRKYLIDLKQASA